VNLSQFYENVSESQSVLMMSNPTISPRTRARTVLASNLRGWLDRGPKAQSCDGSASAIPLTSFLAVFMPPNPIPAERQARARHRRSPSPSPQQHELRIVY
jgi:hypothetical protein